MFLLWKTDNNGKYESSFNKKKQVNTTAINPNTEKKSFFTQK